MNKIYRGAHCKPFLQLAPSRHDFVIAHGRVVIGFDSRGRIITAPADIVLGGVAHGRYVYTKDERKRIKREPSNPSLIKKLNGRLESFFGRSRNFLDRPQHEREYGKPKFDSYRFKNGAVYPGELDQGLPAEVVDWFKFLVSSDANKGAALQATWQGALVGNASPIVKHKVGTDLSRGQLDRIARPLDANGRAKLSWSSKSKHLPWVERSAEEVIENARRYGRRLAAARKGYDDLLRWNGKCTCDIDETYVQAAHRGAQEKLLGREPSGQPNDSGVDGYLDQNTRENCDGQLTLAFWPDGTLRARLSWERAWRDYRLPLLLWVLIHQPPSFILCMLWKPEALFSLCGTSTSLIPIDAQPPISGRTYYEGIHDKITGSTIGNRVLAESDVLRDEALQQSRINDKRRKKGKARTTFLHEDEILPLVMAAKNDDVVARNRIILAFRPVMARIATQYATIATPAGELVTQAIIGTPSDGGDITNGLLYAIDKFDPDNGGAFSSFVIAPITWAISKYAKQQRPHISINAQINNNNDDDDATT